MSVPGNSVVLLILLVVFVASAGYAAGRLHQWYRMDQERDEAYRVGYDTATRNVFSLAARMIGPKRERGAVRGSATVHRSSASSAVGSSAVTSSPSSAVSPVADVLAGAFSGSGPSAGSPAAGGSPAEETAESPGRHTVPDELVQAATYRLAPDRVARAKVRQKPPADLPDDRTSRLPELPQEFAPGVSLPKPRSS